MQQALISAARELISPDEDTTIWPWGYGSPLASPVPQYLTLVLSFADFCGKPDGGLIFPGARGPFAIIEVGVSDSQRKPNSGTEHWLRKAGGQVLPSTRVTGSQVKIGFSMKVVSHKYCGTRLPSHHIGCPRIRLMYYEHKADCTDEHLNVVQL